MYMIELSGEDFLGGSDSKASAYNVGDLGLIPGSGNPLEKEMATTPKLLPRKSHGLRSLVGYSPWHCQESLDTTYWLKNTTTVTFQHIYVPLLYWFLCQQTFRLPPWPGYCKQCCCEHWGACIFWNYGFLWIHVCPLTGKFRSDMQILGRSHLICEAIQWTFHFKYLILLSRWSVLSYVYSIPLFIMFTFFLILTHSCKIYIVLRPCLKISHQICHF